MKRVTPLIILACILFFLIFSPLTGNIGNFWIKMIASCGLLAGIALILQRALWPRLFSFKASDFIVGIGAALCLYCIFYVGNSVSTALFPFARPDIMSIYDKKEGLSLILIALSLFFWIGPAEEIFWRGFLQQRLTSHLGSMKGLLVSAGIYAAVHAPAGNFMLFMAALVCGLFWGFLYKYSRSLWPCIISHALWDVAIFILYPIH